MTANDHLGVVQRGSGRTIAMWLIGGMDGSREQHGDAEGSTECGQDREKAGGGEGNRDGRT